MSILSIVTARKGSKGLKDKVIRLINGKYVFQYCVEYSKELAVQLNTSVVTVVSSDSEVIAAWCKDNKVEYVDRKPELASDTARIEQVMYDAYLRVNKKFDYVSLVYGNMPIRYPQEFIKAYQFLENNPDFDGALSMQNVEKYNPAWMFSYNEDILPSKETQKARRQDLEKFMIHDGHTILVRAKYFTDFMAGKNPETIMYEPFGRKIKPIITNQLIVDVDTQRDLDLACAILKI